MMLLAISALLEQDDQTAFQIKNLQREISLVDGVYYKEVTRL